MTATPDLLSAVIDFQPTHTVALQRETTGQLLHAAVLDLLKYADRALSNDLHNKPQRKPFTLSAIEGLPPGGPPQLEAGRTYHFRVTALSADVAEPFSRLAAGDFELLGQQMTLVGQRAERTASVSLYAHHFNESQTVSQRIGLHFLSPTLVECDDRSCGLFPEPELVFSGLAHRWLDHAYLPPDASGQRIRAVLADATAEAGRSLLVSRYDLRTEPVYFRGDEEQGTHAYLKIGYIGAVEYAASKGADPLALRIFHLLADYAFFAGVGYHTTMGMGQARPFRPGRDRRSIDHPDSQL